MSHFILPVTIDSRKVVFLDIKTNSTNDLFPNKVADSFIIRLPEGVINQTSLLQFKKSRILQALTLGKKDIPINDFKFSIQENEIGCIDIIISAELEGKPSCNLSSSSELSVNEDVDYFEIKYINTGYRKEAETVKVRFVLNHDGEKAYGYSLFWLAPREKIKLLALDFGSEACQMKEGVLGVGPNTNIQITAVDIFQLLRNLEGGHEGAGDSSFEQFESNRLYKSVFYAKNILDGKRTDREILGHRLYWLKDGITMTIPRNFTNINSVFLKTNRQIPNLKLVRNDNVISGNIRFKLRENGIETDRGFSEMRGSLYMALLKQMLKAYFDQRINESTYLRFTLLVPNIYTNEDVLESKKIIDEIFEDYTLQRKSFILGYEIDCLSESDASFLGCQNEITINGSDYFVVIDCGKGTTDFSVLELEQNAANDFRPIYKNGFAGAGNLITYSFVKAASYFLINELSSDPSHQEKIKNFLNENFSDNADPYFHIEFFKAAERWKKNYAEAINISRDIVETEWREAKTGDLTLDKMLDNGKIEIDDFVSILKKLEHCWDWNGYMHKAINNIVETITSQLSLVIMHQNQHASCGGIIITGRGAYFQPLSDAIISGLQQIEGMDKVNRINLGTIDLKEVCLEGVFNQLVRFYADLSSTPVEVDKVTMRQTIKKRSFWSRLFGKGGAVGSSYDPETNALEIINTHNLVNCRFLIGGNIYAPHSSLAATSNSLYLVPTREGVFVVEKDTNQIVKNIFPLIKQNGTSDNSDVKVLESLYPSWWNKESFINTL
jgi:hypothetical protein